MNDALEFRERYPALEFSLQPAERRASATGILQLLPDVAYTVTIDVPRGYPEVIPSLICRPEEIPKTDVRHNSGQCACLCARCDYRKFWPQGSTLAAFVDALVVPFLTCQYYFDVHGQWPDTGQRTHQTAGIWEAYRDFCQRLGNGSISDHTILKVIAILARPSLPGGHNLCPCGSQKQIRKCHRDELISMRQLVSPKDAALDLADIFADRKRRGIK